MIPVDLHDGPPSFPCIFRQSGVVLIGAAAVRKTAYTVVVNTPDGPEYGSDGWQLEGRSGYPPTPPYPMCVASQTRVLGILITEP